MRAEIFTPGEEPAPDGWDAFVRAQKGCALWEESLLEAAAWGSLRPLRAGLVRDAGEPVAAFCGLLGLLPPTRRFAVPGRPRLPGWFQTHLPNSFSRGRMYAVELGPAARTAALRTFERALRRRLGVRCLGVLHLDVKRDELAEIPGTFTVRRATAPCSVLHNRWDSMDAYFAGLPRTRRRRLAALYERIGGDPGLATGRVTAVDPVRASRLDQLTRMKHTRRPGATAPLLPVYFERLNSHPGAAYFAHRERASGRLLSLDLVLDVPAGWATTVTGSDGTRDLYLDLYLREIDRMIGAGVPAVELGPGMRALKESFGAVAVPRNAVAVPF
ncbi:hypothetical protein ACF1FX_07040 [Streptomyces sp. NPDC014646]|uniref:hypothetical protein n=1 Tax=Streptomyces sp. NPDC014646 TaxID=3364877 RepID=UPI0036F5A669